MPAYPATPSLQVGGRVYTDTANLIELVTWDTGTGNCSTFRLPNGSSGYQIPAAKTLRITAIRIDYVTTNAGEAGVKLLYGDTDVGISVAATTPTNPVYEGGSSATNAKTISGITTQLTNNYVENGGLNFTVPTGKYVAALFAVNSAKATVFGYLE